MSTLRVSMELNELFELDEVIYEQLGISSKKSGKPESVTTFQDYIILRYSNICKPFYKFCNYSVNHEFCLRVPLWNWTSVE